MKHITRTRQVSPKIAADNQAVSERLEQDFPPQGKFIYETAIYDGRMKNWRVLNLNTGTFYTQEYDERGKAESSIEDGEKRGEYTVKAVPLSSTLRLLQIQDKAAEIHKGDKVRLKGGKLTAIVLSNELTFANRVVKGACYLDRPLRSFRYWNEDDLEKVPSE